MKSAVSRRTVLAGAAASAAGAAFGTRSRAAADSTLAGRNLEKDKRPILRSDGLRFGVYDPYGDFKNEKGVATEHLFLPWEDVDLESLPMADEYARARGRNIMVTIEPWSWAQDWNVSSAELRKLVLSGERDANMRAICDVLSGFRSPIVIRWAQEMDNPFNRFTWSDWKPADYIAGFRRMHGIVREMLPEARMIWSPRGEKGLQRFYPGDEYVDLVGLTVLGYEKYDVLAHGKARSFAESVKQGYELTAGYGKPVWVAELAYEGSTEYLRRWVNDVTQRYPEYPQLEEVLYFNDREVWEWPHGLGRPDWRVVRDVPSYPVRR